MLTVYRMQDGPLEKTFRLRDLDPSVSYEVLKDGRPSLRAKGEELMTNGLLVRIEEQWRATIYEIKGQP